MSENTNFAPDFSDVATAVVAKATGDVQELHSLVKEIKVSSGGAEAVKEWLLSSEDPEIIAERELIAQFAAKIAERKAALEKIAVAALVPEGADPAALSESFKEKRKATRVLLLQSKGMLESFGQDVSAIDELLENLPTISGTTSTGNAAKSPELLAKIREWARENGHEVADKGRIKAEIVSAYEAATATSGVVYEAPETEAVEAE